MLSPISKPICICRETLTRRCPICGKNGNIVLDDEQMSNCPIGWIKVDNEMCGLPLNCPPYFTCSSECYEILEFQKLLVDKRNGDQNVIIEKLENGKSRIYRKKD